MTLNRGSRIGPYEVTEQIGVGGMGEVYRARDTRLQRDVALKTLPPEFAADPDRLARFQREAQVLASLNHPNIGAIHGLEEANGTRALVLELVEGETLADRLRAPLPVRDALRIAIQICTALEAAHEKGVVHRDLKPANIKITPEGTVKVLDFGLAKAFEGRPGNAAVTSSPTLSMAATQAGIILGTAAYMSPEQASGSASDRRSDIWSFGVVLFEMLTGQRVFGGETVPHVLAAVLAKDPPWERLPANLHPRLRELLERCLAKNASDRYRDIGDVRADLERVLADPRGLTVSPGRATTLIRSRVTPLTAVAATACLALAVAAGWFLRPQPEQVPAPVARFSVTLPEELMVRRPRSVINVSPDGTRIALGGDHLYLREIGDSETRPIPGTRSAGLGVSMPVFSPDGQWLAYVDVAASTGPFVIKRVPISGGTPVAVHESRSNVNYPHGLSWPMPESLMFSDPSGVVRLPANGGATEVLVPANGDIIRSPQLLANDQVLFTRLPPELDTGPGSPTRLDAAQIAIQSIGRDDRTVVWEGGADARYLSSGHLVYAQGTALFAVRFDLSARQVIGGPVSILENVRRSSGSGSDAANYAVSDTGTLVSIPGTGEVPESGVLALVDRDGVETPLSVPVARYRSPRISPDGRQLAVQIIAPGTESRSDIWIYDLSGDSAIRKLAQEGDNTRPIWTPDSRRVTFGSTRAGGSAVYERAADASSVAERLTTQEQGVEHYPAAWSPDGKTLVFEKQGGADGWDLWTFSRERGESMLIAGGPENQFGGAFSPDGRWLAYTEGRAPFGIRVRPFPPTEVIHQVTQDGEAWPVWSAGGDLYFRTRRDVSTPYLFRGLEVSTTGGFTFRNPRALPIERALMFQNYRDYDLTPDGARFVVIVPGRQSAAGNGEPERARADVVLNWLEELRKRVPVN